MENFILVTVTKESGNAVTNYSKLVDPFKMGDIRLNKAGTFVEFEYPDGSTKEAKRFETNLASLSSLQNLINSQAPSGSSRYVGVVNFALGSAPGTYDIKDLNGNVIQIPANSRVIGGHCDVKTPFTTSDAGTIALGYATDGAAALKSATGAASYTGLVALIPVYTAATATAKTTAARNLQYVVANNLTAGFMYIFIDVVTSAA